MKGDLYVNNSKHGDTRFLIVLDERYVADDYDAIIVTPLNRVASVGKRVSVTDAELASDWTDLDVDDER